MNQVLNEDDGYSRLDWNVIVLSHVDEDNDQKLNLQEFTNDFNRVDEGLGNKEGITPKGRSICAPCTQFLYRGRCRRMVPPSC